MNNTRLYIIGGFLVGIGGAIAYTAYSAIKRQEKELAELPFVEEPTMEEDIETEF